MGKLEPQPHGGALARGRKRGSRNKPKPVRERVAVAAGRKCLKAVATLADIMTDPEAPTGDRIRAATALLNYGVGRPRQALDVATEGRLEEGALTERLFGGAFEKLDRREASLREREAALKNGE